ncbi:FHY3/FAR1 family protein [Dioscorea alata]|uniref:FHY3/FAR1 family protein n=1 Tax=Dioscorea alata TaxID=55571 RepID=A0ACB7UKY4_DIOAL|nr:FHY3/FAR1 family protein [Dioscorea alata]
MVLISEITDGAVNEEEKKLGGEIVLTTSNDDIEKSLSNLKELTNCSAEDKHSTIEKPAEVNESPVENLTSALLSESSAVDAAAAGKECYNEDALRIADIMRSYLHMQQTAAIGTDTSTSTGTVTGSDPTSIYPITATILPQQSSSEELPLQDRCKAMMEVVRKEHGKWVVSKLILEHNHPVTPPQQPSCDVLQLPVMGMEFESVEAAKTFYYTFSEQNGYKPRTGSNRRSSSSGALIMQRFLCWRGNYLMYRKPSDINTKKRKRGPYKSRGGKPYEEVEMKGVDIVDLIEVDSSSEKTAVAGEDHGTIEVGSSPPIRETVPLEMDAVQIGSPPIIGTMLWGADDGKGKSTEKASQVASTTTSKLLRELGVRVYRYTNEERRDIILKYMMKRNNRQVAEKPAKLSSRQALGESRQRGTGGKFLSKDEMQTSSAQGETAMADSDTTVEAAHSGEPKVGMVFKNEDKAYEFYIRYAGNVGFSVRKGWWDKSARNVTRSRVYVCSREGFRPKNSVNDGKKPRPETRTGCQARMTIRITPIGKYEVTEFIPDHNHELAAPLDIQMLRSQRLLAKTQSTGLQNGHLIPAEYKNYLRSKRMKEMKLGDAGAMMEYLQKMKGENPSFFYAIQVDVDDQMSNIFWSDANSQLDYYYFGDVVCFDTTYRVNDYGRPLALFLGVNHHKQIVIFAAALLYDETVESYKWLFETFKAAMCGKQPKTILIDQCPTIRDAVGAVWAGTVHRFCAWHVYQSAANHFSHLLQDLGTFSHDLGRCIFDMEDEGEFLSAWESMIEKYDLKDDEWLTKQYEDRDKWALAYDREIFCADFGDALRRESYTTLLKESLSLDKDLREFFKHYDKLVEERRYAERQADYHAGQANPRFHLLRMWQAENAFTPAIFDRFRVEFELFMNCTIYARGEVGPISEYEVTAKEKTKGHYVRFDSSDGTMTCGCKKFEFIGIQCCHALKVLDFRNIKELPQQYILKRWRKDAKTGSIRENHASTFDYNLESSLPKRYNSLCRTLYRIAARAAENVEAYAFLENQSDQLLEQVERILQTRLLEKPSPGNVSKGQTQTTVQMENDDSGETPRLGGKKKKDGSTSKKNNQTRLEASKKLKGRKGQADEVEITVRDNELPPPVGSENIPPQLRNPANQFFVPNQFLQGTYVPSHQYGHGSMQGFHGTAQFGQESSAAALQQQPFHGQLNQDSPAPDVTSLQFVGVTPQMDPQSAEQGHYAIPVWDFL